MKRKKFDWQLPEKIEARLGESSYGKQRTIFEENHLLIVLHDVPDFDNPLRDFKVFLRNPEGEMMCNGKGNGAFMLRKLLDKYNQTYQELEQAYQQATLPIAYFELLEKLAPIYRTSHNLYQTLQSARELVASDKLLIEMRDAAYETQRSFELLLADTKMALDYKIAQSSEEQVKKSIQMVEAQHRLNVIVAIFFPLMTIATIFGMNLKNGLENNHPLIFWGVFIVALITGVAFKNWVNVNKELSGNGSDKK